MWRAAVVCLPACLPTCMPYWMAAGTHRRSCRRAQVEALQNLSYQVRQITHHQPFDHEKLAEKGEWMDAPELITVVEKEKHAAIKMVQVTCRRPPLLVPTGAGAAVGMPSPAAFRPL